MAPASTHGVVYSVVTDYNNLSLDKDFIHVLSHLYYVQRKYYSDTVPMLGFYRKYRILGPRVPNVFLCDSFLVKYVLYD